MVFFKRGYDPVAEWEEYLFQNEVNYLTVTSLENVTWDNFRQMETKLFILQRKLHSVGFYSFSVVSPWRHG